MATSHSFPGFYATVTDNSFNNTPSAGFSLGLIGPATRGNFQIASAISSAGDYVQQFGSALSGAFVAQAVAAVTPYTDNVQIVRVGRQYTEVTASASGQAGNYQLFTSSATSFAPGNYVRVQQPGLPSTVNAQITSVSQGTINLTSTGATAVPLSATYSTAEVDVSTTPAAANTAEAILVSPVYGSALVAAGTVTGTKSNYTFTITGNSAALQVGNVIKITQTGFNATREAVISQIAGQTISLITYTNTATGQQAVPLQDNYTSGVIFVQTGTFTNSITLNAGSPGSWANYAVPNVGLNASVTPGTAQDTKKLLVFLNGALVGTYDNLSMVPTSPNYWGTIFAPPTNVTNNTLVVIPTPNGVPIVIGSEPPANTISPWMPGISTLNVAQFGLGADGVQGLTPADYVGIYDANGNPSGIKVFDDPANFQLSVIAAPGQTDPAVHQELLRVAGGINSFCPLDVPDLLPGPEALDWTNGAGSYSGQPIVNNFRGAYFWNWIQSLNTFTGATEYQPPSIGYLTAAALTFAQDDPWFAAAGEQRGQLQLATGVRYNRVSPSLKQQFFSGTNIMNPILLFQGSSVLVWGNRTTQRLNSQLQNIQAVHLVNYIVQGMSLIGQHYVFDPNDPILYSQLDLAFTNFLKPIVTARGLESFQLTIDSSNNTAATRNARQVIVTLAIIPTEVAEQILLGVTVNQSGAVLNAVNGVATPST